MKIKKFDLGCTSIFVLKLFLKHSPLKVLMEFVLTVLRNVMIVYNSVWLLHYITKKILEDVSFTDLLPVLMIFLFINLSLQFLQGLYTHYLQPVLDIKLRKRLNDPLILHADKLPLRYYETPEFYNSLEQARACSEGTLFSAYSNLMQIGGFSAALISAVLVVININAMLLFFALFAIPMVLIAKHYGKELAEKNLKLVFSNRRKDYSQDLYLSKDYMREFKTTDAASIPKKYYNLAYEESREINKKCGITLVKWDFLNRFFSVTAISGICYLYAILTYSFSNYFQISDFSVLIVAVMNMTSRIGKISKCYENSVRYQVEINKFKQFLDFEEEDFSQTLLPENFHTLEFRHVWFSYDKKTFILRDINFKIHSGEKFALVGYNGSGKTTLINLILRFYEVDRGEILYNGINIQKFNLTAYRAKFAAIFQDYHIFNATLRENILMAPDYLENTNEIRQTLKKMELTELIGSEERVISREFDENGMVLSGGQKQKVALSRLAFKKSDFIVLDEPSAALDPISDQEILKNIAKMSEEKTLIMISHNMSTATMADQVLFLDSGILHQQGSHLDLLKQNKKYAFFFECQAAAYMKMKDGDKE